jgi:hypothetical protein
LRSLLAKLFVMLLVKPPEQIERLALGQVEAQVRVAVPRQVEAQVQARVQPLQLALPRVLALLPERELGQIQHHQQLQALHQQEPFRPLARGSR